MADNPRQPRLMTGAQMIVASLEKLGVDVVFGLPGGAIMPTYDPLMDSSKVRHILVRHEQGAGHAAEGYAVATGRVGVCMATSGPGATNLVTALYDAYLDSVPMMAITGQVGSSLIGTDGFQEADIRGITMPITKHNFLVTEAAKIPLALAEAHHIASTGRPGPVLVDIAKNAQQETAEFVWPKQYDLPGYKPTVRPHSRQIKEAATLIREATRPVLYIGGGVARANAAHELMRLVELTDIPVTTTLMARDVFPDSHPLALGMPGMHGSVAAVGALQRADLIIAVGTRFDDRVTGRLDTFAPLAKVIHADVDPAEIGKNRHADVPIVGDARQTLARLVDSLSDKSMPDISAWNSQLDAMKQVYAPSWEEPPAGKMSPQWVISRIGELAPDDSVFVTGVGQHQMWASHFLPHTRTHTWLTSGGAGTMGYCVPAAMGAQVGRPDSTVWGIDGDGCFQMTNQELVTCALNGIPVKIAIINNNVLGMVRQWQNLFYDQRYSQTDLHSDTLPDFVKLAEALGCVAFRVTDKDKVDEVIEQANAITDRPVVVEFVVHKDAMVWPMVAAGTSNDEIKIAQGLAPDWGEYAEEEELSAPGSAVTATSEQKD
ncbi:acetolactate synthase large subunit [Acidipropionibacterium jensenii]|uniref:acetolactate synthase large subunit n=1 Tax=Acidipropionibacterium jensenii TaxID=1749 RepID=UPI000BC2F1F1|nr:acetolactate synthase large subunit [Acidipropionibacterium jensenii]AZZ42347.1 acetolactate synthase large subunit [Acidipropionibacterium jensenii]